MTDRSYWLWAKNIGRNIYDFAPTRYTFFIQCQRFLDGGGIFAACVLRHRRFYQGHDDVLDPCHHFMWPVSLPHTADTFFLAVAGGFAGSTDKRYFHQLCRIPEIHSLRIPLEPAGVLPDDCAGSTSQRDWFYEYQWPMAYLFGGFFRYFGRVSPGWSDFRHWNAGLSTYAIDHCRMWKSWHKTLYHSFLCWVYVFEPAVWRYWWDSSDEYSADSLR